jgi:hypothetical protein
VKRQMVDPDEIVFLLLVVLAFVVVLWIWR